MFTAKKGSHLLYQLFGRPVLCTVLWRNKDLKSFKKFEEKQEETHGDEACFSEMLSIFFSLKTPSTMYGTVKK